MAKPGAKAATPPTTPIAVRSFRRDIGSCAMIDSPLSTREKPGRVTTARPRYQTTGEAVNSRVTPFTRWIRKT